MDDAPFTFDILLRKLEEVGATLRLNLVTRKPELIPAKDPDLRAEALKLAPHCTRFAEEIAEHVALRCPVCERNVTDQENVERLKGVNPFCNYSRCPYRERK